MIRLAWAALWMAAAVWAQTTGTLQGVVLDASQLPVAGAQVTAFDESSGRERGAVTGADGRFTLGALPVGEYRVRAAAAGFAATTIDDVAVLLGQTTVQRIVLALERVTERIDVQERAEALQTTATTANVALREDRIEESPAPGRNFLNFVLTAPGVAPAAGSNSRRSAASLRGPWNDSGFTFAGMRPRNNSLSIDGVDNRDETTGGNRVAVGLEMVAEFRVSGTPVDPASGNAAGGAVNVVTRSGTNLWHGDFTFFTQNEAANARNPEALVERRPRFRRWQPGASINGPVRRDRTFFSTAIEETWEESEEWSETPAALAGRDGLTRGLFAASDRQREFSFKGNHQFNATHGVSLRYAHSRGRARNDVQDVDNFTDRSARGSSFTRDHSLVGGWTAGSGSSVSDLRVQWAGREAALEPNSRRPMVEIPGVVTFGQSWRLDADRQERHIEAAQSVSLVRARHQVSLGASLHRVTLDARLANRFGGIAVFPDLDRYTAATDAFTVRAFGDPRSRLETLPVAVWAGDRWQPRAGLTIDAGLRYDRQTMPARLPVSNRNVSPRLGIAWQPGGKGKTVFRGAAGLFFDRSPLAFLNDAVQKDGVRGWEIIDGTRAFYRADAALPSTYSRKFTLGAERGLDANTTLTFEYNRVAGYHLPRVRNAALRLPAVFQLEQSARSDYQGASISLNRRPSKELTYLVSWSFGRTDDNASDFDEHPENPADVRREWARSRQHQAHRIAASALAEIPGVDWLEGITWAPIISYGSSRPLNALEAADLFGTGAWPLSARAFGGPRNAFRAPGQFSFDLRVMKTWPFSNDRSRLQVGVESFNLTNHTNPLRVSPYRATLGRALASFGGIVETLNARQVQFLVQFEY